MSKFLKSFLLAISLALLPAVALATGDEYYNHQTFPAPGSVASSALMRAELDLIEAGFGKLPNLAGNGNKFVQVNAAGNALTVGSPTGEFLVGAYGAVCDGVTNDAPSLQSAINAAGAAGGGVVKFDSCIYLITTGLTNVYNNVMLQGIGQGSGRNGQPDFDQAATVIKWGGGVAPAGIMYAMGPTAGAQYGVKGGGIKGIFWEGNQQVGTGIRLRTVNNAEFDVVIEETTVVGFDINTELTVTADALPSQSNNFTRIVTIQQTAGAGIGVRVGGSSADNDNASLNHFGQLQLLHYAQPAIDIGNSDGNLFDFIRIFRHPAGAGFGAICRANALVGNTCRRNVITYIQTDDGGFQSQGTPTAANAAIANQILNYSRGNGSPDPTVEIGSTLSYATGEGAQRIDMNVAVELDLRRSFNTNGSQIGEYKFSAYDSGNAEQKYAGLRAQLSDNTAGAEDGELRIQTTVAGVDTLQAQIIDGWCIGNANGCALGTGKVNVDGLTGGYYVDGMKQSGMETVTYSASMTPSMREGQVHRITVTDGVAFAIQAPSNRDATAPGTLSTFIIRNTSGGITGAATWNAIYKMAAWGTIASGFYRSITFADDATNQVEISRSTDIAN